MGFKKTWFFGLTFLILLVSGNSYSQGENLLDNFQASEINGKVFLTWTMKSGNTCQGIEILRSIDTVNFEIIGTVEGVCGSLTEAKHYSFTDYHPVWNAVNTYKLNLGGEGFSQTVSVELIDVSEKGYVIAPHPISNISKVHFKNDSGSLITLRIYSLNGDLIKIETSYLNYIEVKSGSLTKGEFLFSLSSESSTEMIYGKLIVSH